MNPVAMKGLVVFFVVFGVVAAMVPQDRQAATQAATEDSETAETSASAATPTVTTPVLICAHETPCGWKLYRDTSITVEDMEIPNTYCKCSPDTICQKDEPDPDVKNSYVLKCRPPPPQD